MAEGLRRRGHLGRGPALVACSHGTDEPEARRVVAELAEAARSALGVEVIEAYVDVQEPRLDAVAAALPPGEPGCPTAVIVPLLVSGGYHVHVDVARAAASRGDLVATAPLGGDSRLIDIVLDRLRECGVEPGAAVVLAPAGSRDPRARTQVEAAVADLATRWDGPVSLGFVAAGEPRVAQAVASAREAHGGSVAIASYLLAPGTFQRRLEEAGADAVSGALAPDRRLVEVVCDRYGDALARGLVA